MTSTKLSKGQWRGTHHAFILHWCDQLRKYEDMIDPADHFTDNVKMTMLQNVVSGVSALHQVKTQAAHDVAHGNKPLNYVNYRTLLLSAATVEDEKLSFQDHAHSVQSISMTNHSPCLTITLHHLTLTQTLETMRSMLRIEVKTYLRNPYAHPGL